LAQGNVRVRVSVDTGDPAFDRWWLAAEQNPASVPVPARPLFAGRDVIEVTQSEAEDIRQWAVTIPGWNAGKDGSHPLVFRAVSNNVTFGNIDEHKRLAFPPEMLRRLVFTKTDES
jgi:hypothetical protein